MQSVDVAREVFEKLSEKLGDEDLFYAQLSSLDITAYAYLKELLVNCEDEIATKMLKEKYPTLVKLVKRFDDLLDMKKWDGDKPVLKFREQQS